MAIKDLLTTVGPLKRMRWLFLFVCGLFFTKMAEATDTIVLSNTSFAARTLVCGTDVVFFDRGGEQNNGIYTVTNGQVITNWFYFRTEGTGTPIHIEIDAQLANNCKLTVFKAYPTNDDSGSPQFPINNTSTSGPNYLDQVSGTEHRTIVSANGVASIRFQTYTANGTYNCNFRIRVWASDTSEVYDITNSNITATSAQVSWLDSSAATAWTVRYGTSANNLTHSVAVTSPTATLSGLTPNTPYYVRVYNNAQTTEEMSGYCTRNDDYFITQGTEPVPIGCLGDFTDLDSPHVICTYGHYDNPDENYGIASGRHTVITDVDGRDPIIGDALRMVPEGATASVRLGNSGTGNQAESVIYRFQVDATQNDMLLLRYAAVLQYPGHRAEIQPRLSLQILRADGSEIDNDCYKMEFVASSVMTTGVQWQEHIGSDPTPVHWHDWTAVGVDLTQLNGQEIYIKLTTRDCNHSPETNGGAHYGYAYLTLECCKKSINYVGCGENASPMLVAPAGFSYNWHEVGSSETLSTDREFVLPDDASGVYECTMTFYGSINSACSFGMTADPSLMTEFPHAGFIVADEAVAAGTEVAFSNTSFLSRDEAGNEVLPNAVMASYQWNFGDGYTSTEENPSHVFPSLSGDRTYAVTLTAISEVGCTSQYQATVLVYGTGSTSEYGDLLSEECLLEDNPVDWGAPTLEWTSPDLLSTYTIPLVGDLNGDGHPDIVCFAYNSSTSFTKTIGNSGDGRRINTVLAVYDGVTKNRISNFVMKDNGGVKVWADEFSVAPYGILRTKIDVNGQEQNKGLIVVATTRSGNSPSDYSGSGNNYYLQAYDINGQNIWTSSAPYGTDVSGVRREFPATVSFADFNGDGYPEVYVRNKVFDAATGQLLLEVNSANNNEANSWAHKCGSTNGYGILSAPFAADLSGDGLPELILGNEVYQIEITSRTGTVGNSATLWASHTPPNNNATDGNVQVADFNADGHLDVFISSRPNYTGTINTYYYVWDVFNDEVSNVFTVSNNNGGKSIPLIADIDNDDTLEVVVQHPRSSGNRMQALKYNPSTRTFSEMWGRPNGSGIDDSWSNTLTMFDFNGDGNNELLFSGRSNWYVLDGTDGHEVATMPFSEVTIMDYPIIADVDNDGSAEIITIDKGTGSDESLYNGHLHIFQSSGAPWKYARPVWNQYMYNATCVNRDLTIPAHPVNNALMLTDPNGVTRQPFNNFLQQVGLLDLFGRPSQYAADLTVEVPDDPGQTQDNQVLTIPLHLCNNGSVEMQAPFSIAFYSDAYRGDVIETIELSQTQLGVSAIAVGGCVDVTLQLSVSDLCDLPSTQLLLAVNDNGGGIAQHGNQGQQGECDTINNRLTLSFQPCVVEATEEKTACDQFTWRDGVTYMTSTPTSANPTAPTFLAQGANGDPDTLYTLHLTINYSSTEPVPDVTECDRYTWHGTEYTEGGDYSYTDANMLNAAGCPLTETLHLTISQSATEDTMASECDRFDWYEHTNLTQSSDNLTHTFVGQNGCDSVVTLHLTIRQSATEDTMASECDRFDWYEHTNLTQSSDNLTHTFVGQNGCDSVVTLHLTIRQSATEDTMASECDRFDWYEHANLTQSSDNLTHTFVGQNGCDSVVTLHLTINNPQHEAFTEAICESFTWNNEEYTESGDYTYPHQDDNGCLQVDTLHLTINIPQHEAFSEAACEFYTWNNEEYTESGDYNYPHQDDNGCLQVDTLHLTINIPQHEALTETACETYNWNNEEYTESGDYTYPHQDANGCLQVDTLHLTISDILTTEIQETACGSYTWNGTTYTESTTQSVTLQSVAGCDSIVMLYLTISNILTTEIQETACGSYTWNGTTYTESTTQSVTLQSAAGCDSIVMLYLTISDILTTEIQETACGSYTWNGTTYTESTTQSVTLQSAAGCDSIVTLYLTISNILTTEIQETACGSYTWNGTTYTESTTQSVTLQSAAGCDSIVTLYLTINNSVTGDTTAAECNSFDWYEHANLTQSSDNLTHAFVGQNGCDSVVTLHLTINIPQHEALTETACETYNWNNEEYTESGDYTYPHQDDNGCLQVDTLHLTINIPQHEALTETACETFTWNNEEYTESGDYTYPHQDANGCLQVDTLHLTINIPQHEALTETACETYNWNNEEYTESGDYTYPHQNSNGCLQVDTLHLTISDILTTDLQEMACGSYTWNGTTYTESAEPSVTLQSAAGCDSVVTLHLTINHSTTGDTTAVECDSFTWHGITYTESTTLNYQLSILNSVGCDSIVTLYLTINTPQHEAFTEAICESYTWNNEEYTESGDYTYPHQDDNGCMQVDTLHLTINNPQHEALTETACETYNWNNEEYTESGDYTYPHQDANGCLQVDTLHLTISDILTTDLQETACENYEWNGVTYTESAEPSVTLQSAAGCDSVVTLHLTINHSTTGDTTAVECDSFTWQGTTYTESTTLNSQLSILNSVGCDSVVTLHLTINHSTTGDTTAVECDSFTWQGTTYTESTTLNSQLSILNSVGCDSVVTLHLTINHPYTHYIFDTTYCGISYPFADTVFLSEAETTIMYERVFTSSAGCDSTVILHLFIKQVGAEESDDQFVDVNIPTDLCAGDVATLTIGYAANSNVVISNTPHVTTLGHAERIFLPDGVECDGSCSYMSPVTFDAFQEGATVNSVEDIKYVRLNMEHSWIGDIFIAITCPNGQMASLMNYGGSGYSECNATITNNYRGWNTQYSNAAVGTYFGLPIDSEGTPACDSTVAGNAPGIGWNYCWSDNTTSGYSYASGDGLIYRATNLSNHSIDSSDVLANTNFYHPDQSFSSLVGCPLNGTWSIEVIDAWGADNGYIFSWELALNASLVDAEPCPLVERQMIGPYVHRVNDSVFSVQVPSGLTQDTVVTYTFRLVTACGVNVDTTATIRLHPMYATQITDTMCSGESYGFFGEEYAAAGDYTHVAQTIYGCDSVVTLHLVVNSGSYRDTAVSACNEYTWGRNGVTYGQSGEYHWQYENVDGCNDTIVLLLELFEGTYDTVHIQKCGVYEWNGHVYDSSGIYTYEYENQTGCASVDTLMLTILEPHYTDTFVTACLNYLWERNGEVYDSDGVYIHTYVDELECENVDSLHLTIVHHVTSSDSDTVCEGEAFRINGEEFYGTGDYQTTFQTESGCDSIVTIHLFARPRPEVHIMVEYGCPQEEYRLSAATDGQFYTWSTQPANHQLTGHEHDTALLLRPRDTMQLYLTVDYAEGRSCPNSDQVELVPIHNVVAAMECHPEVLNRDRRTMTAIDASVGNTDLAWYVDGLYWGNDPAVVCTAADEAQEIILRLVAFNDHCADTVERIIQVVDESLYVPNVFTPTLSTNSTFRAYGTGILEYRIVIYNREGLKVFEADNIESEWDGTHDGVACPQANYVYRIQYRGELVPDGWKSVTGSVLLLR